MKDISTKTVYETDQEFKDYVNNFARERQILVTEALTYKTVEEVAKYYLEKNHG